MAEKGYVNDTLLSGKKKQFRKQWSSFVKHVMEVKKTKIM